MKTAGALDRGEMIFQTNRCNTLVDCICSCNLGLHHVFEIWAYIMYFYFELKSCICILGTLRICILGL